MVIGSVGNTGLGGNCQMMLPNTVSLRATAKGLPGGAWVTMPSKSTCHVASACAEGATLTAAAAAISIPTARLAIPCDFMVPPCERFSPAARKHTNLPKLSATRSTHIACPFAQPVDIAEMTPVMLNALQATC